MAAIEQTERRASDRDETATEHEEIDFKMVTFSLGGKDYGIDIMRVKEIAKFFDFTMVPNTAPYVRGVYNLRGDIISIIDLRVMFNIPAEKKPEGKPENGLILRLENHMLGVIVDSIDKVIGFSRRQIQPPHPIFGDINIKYISGVAEHNERLYIILDVDRIFGRDEPETVDGSAGADAAQISRASEPESPGQVGPPNTSETPKPGGATGDHRETSVDKEADAYNRDFVIEGLATFTGFHVSPVNQEWFDQRLDSWEKERRRVGKDVQFSDKAEADEFLSSFFSACTGNFWDDEYLERVAAAMPEFDSTVIHVWNPGCGGGYESYSLAIMLSRLAPDRQVKIWSGDTDLMKISTAPNLVFRREAVPESWHEHLVSSKNGYTFSQDIKDRILFEFSDVLNGAGPSRMDLVVARDVISFFAQADQKRAFSIFEEALKPQGLVLLGDNEAPLDAESWRRLDKSVSVHRIK